MQFDYDKIWTSVYGDMQEMGPTHRHLRRLEDRILATIDYRSVLDVGCGPGSNFEILCRGRQIERVAGLDISEWAIERARQQVGGEFEVLDVQEGFLDGQWDLVNCSLVLEHLPDDVAALRNIRKMTGKYFLASTIAGNFERYRPWEDQVGHVRNYQPGELESKLIDAGFTVCRSLYWGFPFYSPILRTLQNGSQAANQFSPLARLAAQLVYYVYFMNSSRRGDILIVLAQTPEQD